MTNPFSFAANVITSDLRHMTSGSSGPMGPRGAHGATGSTGAAGAAGSSTYVGLSDAITANLPTLNVPLSSALANKQTTLIAGQNVVINGNTISASITSSSGTGATSYSALSDGSTINLATFNTPLYTALLGKQASLIAGAGISITGTTISSSSLTGSTGATGPTGSAGANTFAALTDAATATISTTNTSVANALTAVNTVIATKQNTVYINVLDYGADPTGVVASNSAFTNAITAATTGSNPCLRVYVPPGLFYLTSPVIQVPLVLEIFGTKTGVNTSTSTSGNIAISGQSILRCTNNAGFTFSGSTSNIAPIYIHDLSFMSAINNISAPLIFTAGSVALTNPVILENLSFYNSNATYYFSTCILLGGSTNCITKNCMFNNTSATYRPAISIASFEGSTTTPSTAGTLTMQRCSFYNYAGSVTTSVSYSLDFDDCIFSNNVAGNAVVMNTGATGTSMRNLKLRNSTLINAAISIPTTNLVDGGIISIQNCAVTSSNSFVTIGQASGALKTSTAYLNLCNNSIVYQNTASTPTSIFNISQITGLLITGNICNNSSATGVVKLITIDASCSNGIVGSNIAYASASGGVVAANSISGTNILTTF